MNSTSMSSTHAPRTAAQTMDAVLSSCGTLVTGHGGVGVLEGASEQGSQDVRKVVQIAVLCVLCVAVIFAIVFLGCNLLIRSESLLTLLAKDRRPSKETEVVVVGT